MNIGTIINSIGVVQSRHSIDEDKPMDSLGFVDVLEPYLVLLKFVEYERMMEFNVEVKV